MVRTATDGLLCTFFKVIRGLLISRLVFFGSVLNISAKRPQFISSFRRVQDFQRNKDPTIFFLFHYVRDQIYNFSVLLCTNIVIVFFSLVVDRRFVACSYFFFLSLLSVFSPL